MMRFASTTLAILALGANTPSAAAQVPLVFDQTPCPLQSGFCAQLDSNATNFVIREFQFTAPKAGRAVVTFNGSMLCIASSVPLGLELLTQIVPAGGTAAENGPSSNRLGAGFNAAGSTGFNLASTRVFNYRRPGTYKVQFAMRKIALIPTTFCVVTNAAFTVLYLPVK